MTPERRRILYLAPWVDFGGTDKGTIDWFRWMDRSRWELLLATTQPSENRRLGELLPYATEAWPLPDLVAGQHMPPLIFDLVHSRAIPLLHLMNSRLAFELLPDLGALPNPPKVVVQLHVEERDRGGYVRYVTRRYGNLVDAFSVTSEHLADAVAGYGIPRAKIHVIPTGVDAREEFSPQRARPVAGIDPGVLNVLYPGRLVEQKDPLLMVDVIERLVPHLPGVRVHVVGDGPLEQDVRRAVAERGLDSNVVFHPPTWELAQWYAACDVLLMTSVFEGVPYVVFEAMAMGLPVVAPALPGNVELLRGEGGALIEPRDDAGAYAAELRRLADGGLRERIGARSRERALGELSLRAMADAHGRLYERLLDGVPQPQRRGPRPAPRREGVRFARSPGERPLVSVIVPCFNQGSLLRESLAAIAAQDYPDVEVLVVDDCSTDPLTQRVFDELEAEGEVRVLRMPHNAGPAAARNAALAVCRGRHVLPVDSDNLLLPGAIGLLVDQLAEAGEQVGFVYPNLQFFGNRRDYFRAPAYNLFELLQGNLCDTCSLFDADVFRIHGFRFGADIRLGHEDWDLVLQLAAAGIRGEAAHAPTLLYRKVGFTRSDTVEHAGELFADLVRKRHPELYGDDDDVGRYGRWAGPALTVKARWAPGLSVVVLRPVESGTEAGDRLRRVIERQSVQDAEYLIRTDAPMPVTEAGARIRRIPAALAASPAAALTDAIGAARASRLLVLGGDPLAALEDPAFLEQTLRVTIADPRAVTTVFADIGAAGRYPLRRLAPDEAPVAEPHGLLSVGGLSGGVLHPEIVLDGGRPLTSLVRALDPSIACWRHLPGGVPRDEDGPPARLCLRPDERARVPAPADLRPPALPALAWDAVRRWLYSESWMPPGTLPLVRHRQLGGERRIVTNQRTPPAGYAIEFDLGCVQQHQPPGTAELRAGGERDFFVIPDADEGAPRMTGEPDPASLGFIEEVALPLLDPLELGYDRATGQWMLVSGRADPFFERVEERSTLGFVEAYPNHPRLPPVGPPRVFGCAGLTRAVDRASRRHVHAVGASPPPHDELSLELGAVSLDRQAGMVPLWIDADGRPWTEDTGQAQSRSSRAAARWTLAPLTWRGHRYGVGARARAVARRALDLRGTAQAVATGAGAQGAPAGYLWTDAQPGMLPVHLAVHPVTGDRMLTRWPLEAADMGYGEAVLVGWCLPLAPATGSLDARPVDVPWASRFGRRARRPEALSAPVWDPG